ncbi:hypothetical protein Henu3_gp46 [Mycobacterium phage Henu3]|uniref:Uncharacterized protein n=1 Tax=Mycobacterium phage Henu3 TaxID=2492961 RepID=A0A410T824_9CAUD|nr:hypothetical protein I5G68_gp43 [Mycobacterium phage Henu3]QAU04989.1 hypothetical protein Henu3_gp46 [Mycobacterium phage Henu3]
MLLSTLVSTVVTFTLRALWVRRLGWGSYWERGQSLTLVFQCLAIVLIAPTGSTIGRVLKSITGIGYLDVYLGHVLYISAAVAMLANVMSRVTSTHGLRDRMKRHVETVAPPAIALMFACLVLSDAVDEYCCVMFNVPADFWLTAYWLIGATTLGYLLAYIIRCLRIVRDQDPRSRSTATWQLVAMYVLSAANVWVPIRSNVRYLQEALPGAPVIWTLTGISAVLLVISAVRSWQQKTQSFNTLWNAIHHQPRPRPRQQERGDDRPPTANSAAE